MKMLFTKILGVSLVKRVFNGAIICAAAVTLFMSSTVLAKNVKYRKTQDVDFEASQVDGLVRNPDGAYLVQKRTIDFMPLYQVRKNFDDKISEASQQIR